MCVFIKSEVSIIKFEKGCRKKKKSDNESYFHTNLITEEGK